MAQRVLHPMKIRRLRVAKVKNLSPSLRRLSLHGDLDDFPTGLFSPGDHVRLILPGDTGQLVLPQVENDRVVRVPGIGPARDYTPRALSAEGLVIDMLTSHNGPVGRRGVGGRRDRGRRPACFDADAHRPGTLRGGGRRDCAAGRGPLG